MVYAVLAAFGALGFAFGGYYAGVWGPLLWWMGFALAVVGAGYGGAGPGVFGKRADGTRAWWAYPLVGPYLVGIALARIIEHAITGEAVYDEVSPGLYVGRRIAREALPSDTHTVVDLTAELLDDRRTRSDFNYICLPTLDGTPPSREQLVQLVDRIARVEGPLYIHCAAGHGRSALVAACLLVKRGLASDIRDAVTLMRRKRPRVRLMRSQRQLGTLAIEHGLGVSQD